jgi:hypothetical protein
MKLETDMRPMYLGILVIVIALLVRYHSSIHW